MLVFSSLCARVCPTLTTLALVIGVTASGSIASAEIQVVASIKPVHSLTSAVMAGVGKPRLLIRGSASPHTFNLRPSDAAAIADADVVFLIDEAMETSLARSLETLARQAQIVALAETDGLIRLPFRDGGVFETDSHEGHGDGHEAGEARGHDEDHGEERGEDEAAGHDDHDQDKDQGEELAESDADGHDHAHGEFDLHVWLDPVNGAVMVRAISDALSEADPANAPVYKSNARALLSRLDALAEQVSVDVAPARGKPFVVFHDGYRYFENRFALTPIGSVVVNPERPPGARRIRQLRSAMREFNVECVFAEPQFNMNLVDVLLEGTETRSGIVDPLGAEIENGPELYFTLLKNMATDFRHCLAPDEQER